MLVMVTGATGFVGSHVVRQLLAGGHAVKLLVRDADKARRIFADLASPRLELVTGDITDLASVQRALACCDGVVHAAAGTPINIGSVAELFKVNVQGTQNVIGSAVAAGIKAIVHLSSITVIFNTDAAKVTADAPVVPSRMPYGRSKMEAELYVRGLQQQGAPISIVYPGGVIGPDDPGFSDAFKALHHRINHGFRIFGDGGMQHVDVRDLAAFVVTLLEQGGDGRYLLPGPYLRWTELADILDEVTGKPVTRIPARGWQLRLVGRALDLLRLVKPVASPVSAETMRYATQWPAIQNTPELGRRGLALRPARDTFRDSLAWMLAAGYLNPEQAPRLAGRNEAGSYERR